MNELVERQLTAIEIRHRQVDHLRLLTEIDNCQDEVEEHQRCAKESKTEIERLKSRERELRRELRSGCVWEARQKKLDFADGSTDEPAPEIDPPPADDSWAIFTKRWPVPRDALQLRTDLSVVLQGVNVPTLDQLREWHPDTGIFQAAAHWVRLELAYMNADDNPEIVLPSRLPIPDKLEELLKGKAPKKKRAKKPKAAPSFHGSGAVD